MENLFRFDAQNHHLMKKSLFYSSIFISILFIFSCVPPDPAMVYGWNTPTPPGPGGNITGPRILHKIDSSNTVQREYFSSNAGVLEKVKYYNSNVQVDVLYNSNNKVSKLIRTKNQLVTVLTLNYDSAGKISGAVGIQTLNNIFSTETHYTLVYNSAGKVTKVNRKMKFSDLSTVFTHYGVNEITWVGDNVTKVNENGSVIHSDGSYEPLDPMGWMVFRFENHDNKINPFTTLSKEFNIGMGILAFPDFGNLSYNNPTKLLVETAFQPPFVENLSLLYDPQNYLISDSQGIYKFHYKPVQ